MAYKIAYVMSRFPQLSETFILGEMIELERHGWDIHLYPLIIQQQTVIHEEAKTWLLRMHRLPFFSLSVLVSNARTVVRRPTLYLAILLQLIWENRKNLKFLLRGIVLFPKSVCVAEQMQQEGIAHIHAHFGTHPALSAWIIHRLTGISYSISVHAHDIFVRTDMLKTKLKEAVFIAAISEYNRDYLASIMGLWVREKIHIVRCGINPEKYQPYNKTDIQRKSQFKIISIGSLQPYKGFSFLIQACAMLRDRGIPFHCRIIGGGEGHNQLLRMIEDNQLGNMIELLGPQSQEEIIKLLPTADCYVQPSIITSEGKMEGIPVSIMEALACSLPVVASKLSGIPELIKNGETGYLILPANAIELADALSNVYIRGKEAKQLGQNGRALVVREFNLKKNVTKLSSLFTEYSAHFTREVEV